MEHSSGLFCDGDLFQYAVTHGFGDFHVKIDPKTGMQAIIAIHSTKLGPALGGCRFIEYDNPSAALYDAMRLARGMSYKAALVNLPLGGGKAVIMKPKTPFNRDAYFDAFSTFVQEQQGRYITALDSGTQLSDMDRVGLHTPYVASLSKHGDPSPATAEGIFHGIEAAVYFQYGKNTLENLHIALQGLGHVGYRLATLLHQAGAKLTVADLNPATVQMAVKTFDATSTAVDTIHQTACDVFAPCALGAILNDETIPELNTRVVAGAANNQLAHTYHGQILHDKGILYAPDYVINAGGLIFAASQYLHGQDTNYQDKLSHIHDSLMHIFESAKQQNKPTSQVADQIAFEKLQ